MQAEQLMACTGCTSLDRARKWLPFIVAAMGAYGITTPRRQAAFLAQIGHESGGLAWVREIWGPTPTQARYEGRRDLGNTEPGDGSKYRGHGLIQVTGRANHARAYERLKARFKDTPDFVAQPEALTEPRWAALSAADFWDRAGLNKYADAVRFDAICDLINRGHITQAHGDANGYKDRVNRYTQALASFLA